MSPLVCYCRKYNISNGASRGVVVHMKEKLNCDGFNLLQNNEETAGQTVFHFHMHLIPRYQGDQVGITWKPGELSDKDREEILAKLGK